MSTSGTGAGGASVGISDSLSIIALSSTSESNALTISFVRDVKEFSNTVPSLIEKKRKNNNGNNNNKHQMVRRTGSLLCRTFFGRIKV